MSKKSTNKLAPEMRELQEIALDGLPRPIIGELPSTPRDLVQVLTNVSKNRLDRIRELERQIYRLCELGKTV